MQQIARIQYDHPDHQQVVSDIEVITSTLIVWGVERGPDNIVLGGFFALTSWLKFFDCQDNLVSFSSLMKIGGFSFEEKSIMFENQDDPEVQAKFESIVDKVPLPDTSIKN